MSDGYVNTFALSFIRFIQRLSIVLTLSCCAYIIFFFFTKNQDILIPENDAVASTQGVALMTPSPSTAFDLKPFDALADSQGRDIFSLTPSVPSGAAKSTPKGQLPDNLKIVGILIAHPSQIVIEDTSTNSTYFIDEGESKDGVKIVKVDQDRMTINYQGQDIVVPVSKN